MLLLLSEHVVLVDDDERGRQTLEAIQSRSER